MFLDEYRVRFLEIGLLLLKFLFEEVLFNKLMELDIIKNNILG